MRKKIIALVSVIVVFGIMLGAWLIVSKKPVETEVTDSPTPAATAIPRTAIFELAIENTKYLTIKNVDLDDVKLERSMKVENDGAVDVYSIVGKNVEVDETEIKTIFQIFSGLKGQALDVSTMEDSSDSDYGFDRATIVTMEMTDGSKHVLEVGDYVTGNNGAFARKQGETQVYVITRGDGLYLKSNPGDLRNKYLFVAGAEEYINRIKMTQKGVQQFIIEGEQTEDKQSGIWRVIEPVSWRLRYESDLLYFFDQFYSIIASECIETTDFETYGLINPAYEIEFTVDNKKTHKIALGNKTETGEYFYAKWNDDAAVYLVSSSSFQSIDKNLKSMISELVTMDGYYDLNKFEVEYNGVNHVFEVSARAGDKNNDSFKYNGKLFTQTAYPEVSDAFRNVYKSTLGLWAEAFEPEAGPELINPEITVKYHNKGTKRILTVQYVRKDADRFYIFVDGEYTGVTAKASILNNAVTDMTPGVIAAIDNFEDKIKTVN